MDADDLVAELTRQGPALAAAASRAGWAAAVPGTVWTVRDLVTHVGGVHRWATDIVATASADGGTDASRAVGTGPGDEQLIDWFLAGHRALVDTLDSAPEDLDCFAFLPAASPRAFWIRRQAHETAVHRADAERAAGLSPAFDADFAQDGIDEILTGFARRRSNAIDVPARVVLRAVDGDDWTVTLGGARIGAERVAGEDADVVVEGSSGALYQWLWNRPAPVTVTGDAAAAELWRRVRVTWS